MTTTTTNVLIIGAGPTGLTIGTILAHSGVTFRILDKKAGPTEETRAVVVHAKSLELWDKLGLAEKAVANGEKVSALNILNVGKIVEKFSLVEADGDDRTPYPFALTHGQYQTEYLLLQNLIETGNQVEWNTELLYLEQGEESVRATIRHASGIEETIEARWVVGADGSHSPVRHSLALGFEGETYEQPLFLADVDLEWEIDSTQAYIDLTPSGFLAFFPMSGEKHFRVIGSLPPELAARESITIDDVQYTLDNHSGLHLKILESRWTSLYRTHHRMSQRFRVGRVFLVGDAAHIHSPAGGQGMNTGIGDAYNLAWKLALVIKGQAREALLDSYEAERMPFACAILHGSDTAFHFLATTNPVGQKLKLFTIPRIFRLLRIPAFRRKVFWLVSQLWTSYRGSPAVSKAEAGKKGLQPGDRAPYGFFEAGPDAGTNLFTKLRGLDHHLLLFAGSRPGSTLADPRGLETRLCSLLNTYAVPVHLHTIPAGNTNLHQSYGADEASLFLIRPDGHIAYQGKGNDLNALKTYLDGLFTREGAHEKVEV